jgi:hypothetical protein
MLYSVRERQQARDWIRRVCSISGCCAINTIRRGHCRHCISQNLNLLIDMCSCVLTHNSQSIHTARAHLEPIKAVLQVLQALLTQVVIPTRHHACRSGRVRITTIATLCRRHRRVSSCTKAHRLANHLSGRGVHGRRLLHNNRIILFQLRRSCQSRAITNQHTLSSCRHAN